MSKCRFCGSTIKSESVECNATFSCRLLMAKQIARLTRERDEQQKRIERLRQIVIDAADTFESEAKNAREAEFPGDAVFFESQAKRMREKLDDRSSEPCQVVS